MDEKKRKLLKELFLYGVIGGSTALLDVLIFKLLLIVGLPVLLSNFISVNIAIASSFLLNAKYNFKKTNSLRKRALKFFTVGYLGLIISLLVLWIGVDLLGLEELSVKIVSVIIIAAIQYVLNKFLTFKD